MDYTPKCSADWHRWNSSGYCSVCGHPAPAPPEFLRRQVPDEWSLTIADLRERLVAAEAERDRLRAFVAAFDAWHACGNISGIVPLYDAMLAAREAVK